MDLPIEYQQELTRLTHSYYYRKDEELVTTQEAMKILRIENPKTLSKYIERGLVCLKMKPRVFVMEDIRNFIKQNRRSDVELQVKPLKLY
jgi:hypothetical protein